jgi:hypothetical protein
MHIYMKMSQGNSLCNDLKQIKMSFYFFFIKSQNERVEHVLFGREGG